MVMEGNIRVIDYYQEEYNKLINKIIKPLKFKNKWTKNKKQKFKKLMDKKQ